MRHSCSRTVHKVSELVSNSNRPHVLLEDICSFLTGSNGRVDCVQSVQNGTI
jgi:hypothetical protein